MDNKEIVGDLIYIRHLASVIRHTACPYGAINARHGSDLNASTDYFEHVGWCICVFSYRLIVLFGDDLALLYR